MKTLYIQEKVSSPEFLRSFAYLRSSWILDFRSEGASRLASPEWRESALILALGDRYLRCTLEKPALAKMQHLFTGVYTNGLVFLRGADSRQHLDEIVKTLVSMFWCNVVKTGGSLSEGTKKEDFLG